MISLNSKNSISVSQPHSNRASLYSFDRVFTHSRTPNEVHNGRLQPQSSSPATPAKFSNAHKTLLKPQIKFPATVNDDLLLFDKYIAPSIPKVLQGQNSTVIFHGTPDSGCLEALWGRPPSPASSSFPTQLQDQVNPSSPNSKRRKSDTPKLPHSAKLSQGIIHRACRALFIHIETPPLPLITPTLLAESNQPSNIPVFKSKLKQPSAVHSPAFSHARKSSLKTRQLSSANDHPGYDVSISYYQLPESNDSKEYAVDLLCQDSEKHQIEITSIHSQSTYKSATRLCIPNLTEVSVNSYSQVLDALNKATSHSTLCVQSNGPTVFSIRVALKKSNSESQSTPNYFTFIHTNGCWNNNISSLSTTLSQISESNASHYNAGTRLVRRSVSVPASSLSLNVGTPQFSKVSYKHSTLTDLTQDALAVYNSNICLVACISPPEDNNALETSTKVEDVMDVLEFAHIANPSKCCKTVNLVKLPNSSNENTLATPQGKKVKSYGSLGKFGGYGLSSSLTTTPSITSPERHPNIPFATFSNNSSCVTISAPQSSNVTDPTPNKTAIGDTKKHISRDSLSSNSSGSSASCLPSLDYTSSSSYSTLESSISNASHTQGFQHNYALYNSRKASRPLSFVSDSTQESESIMSLTDTSLTSMFSIFSPTYNPASSSTSSPPRMSVVQSSASSESQMSYLLSEKAQAQLQSLVLEKISREQEYKDLLTKHQAVVQKQEAQQNEAKILKIQVEKQKIELASLQEKLKSSTDFEARGKKELQELEQINKELWGLVEEYEQNMDDILKDKNKEDNRLSMFDFDKRSSSGSIVSSIIDPNLFASEDYKDGLATFPTGSYPSPTSPVMNNAIQKPSSTDNSCEGFNTIANDSLTAAHLTRRLQSAESSLVAARHELRILRSAQRQHASESQFLTKRYNVARREIEELKKANLRIKKKLEKINNIHEDTRDKKVDTRKEEKSNDIESLEQSFDKLDVEPLVGKNAGDNRKSVLGAISFTGGNPDAAATLEDELQNVSFISSTPSANEGNSSIGSIGSFGPSNPSSSRETFDNKAPITPYRSAYINYKYPKTILADLNPCNGKEYYSPYFFDESPSNPSHPANLSAFSNVSESSEMMQEILQPSPESPDSPFIPKYKLRLNPFNRSVPTSPLKSTGHKATSNEGSENELTTNNNSNNSNNSNDTNDTNEPSKVGHKRHRSLAAFNLLQFPQVQKRSFENVGE